jgi:predicted negative regulator of RcsB-dependent stress response
VEVYQTEEQQVESLKQWWAKNARSTVVALLVGLGIILGGRAWVDYKNSQSDAASMLYHAMLTAMQDGKSDAALEQGARILGQYDSTPYATLAALASAKVKLEQGDSTSARTQLQWVLDHGKPQEMVNIARLRMARLLMDSGEAQQALTLLGNEPPDGFVVANKELEGDLYRALGQIDNARSAYRSAISALTPQARNRAELQMKLDDVGGGTTPVETPHT